MTTETPLFVTNPEAWLTQVTEANDFVGVVIFRGSWCKYDKHYLHQLGKYNKDKMKKEGLKLIAWTSEGQEGANKADEEWGLTKDYGFAEVIGDETNALAKYLVDDCILEHLVTMTPSDAKVTKLIVPGSYPNGLVQPGMIWYAHHGNLVLQWESNAQAPSFGGKIRPDPVGKLSIDGHHHSIMCHTNLLSTLSYLGSSSKTKTRTGQGGCYHACSWKSTQTVHIRS